MTSIWISADLACQAAHAGDGAYELFPPTTAAGDCGTFLLAGGALYAPDFSSHGGTATGSLGAYTAFTPVSQSALSGAGTRSSPYAVVTEVRAGASGIRIVETDRYVVGDEFYSTNVTLVNEAAAAQDVILWRAGDCYLGGSDAGYGSLDATAQRVGCIQNAGDSPPGRFEEWIARSPGSHARQNNYNDIWATIGAHTAFDDTCLCASLIDNGAGLSWNLTLPVNRTVSIQHDLRFAVPSPVLCRADGLAVSVDGTEVTLGHAQAIAVTHGGALPAHGADPAPPTPAIQTNQAWVAQPGIGSPLYVQATGVFGRCDAGLAANASTSGLDGYGRAGLAELTVASCASCPALLHVEGLDREIEARSNGTAAVAFDACDAGQLDSSATRWAHVFALCDGRLVGIVSPIASPGAFAPPPVPARASVPDGVDRAVLAGRAAYEGAALNVTLVADGHTIQIVVGRVHVEVPATTAAASAYALNRDCASARACT